MSERNRLDMAYGRRGGHLMAGAPSEAVARAKPCEECGGPMVIGAKGAQRGRHSLCDPDSIVGRVCSCPPGCTVDRIGDGPRDCAPDCPVCAGRHGVLHKKLFGAGS